MTRTPTPDTLRRAVSGGGWRVSRADAGATSADLYIYDVIGWGVWADELAAELSQLDVAALNVYINSPGGDAHDGVAIYNLLRRHQASVHVTVDGIAASAASVIALAGDSITMGPGSEFMVHDPWTFAMGDQAELARAINMLETTAASYASIYAGKAGGDVATWRAVMAAETWYTAEEAVAAGLADQVADQVAPAAHDVVAGARFDVRALFTHPGRASAPAPMIPAASASVNRERNTVPDDTQGPATPDTQASIQPAATITQPAAPYAAARTNPRPNVDAQAAFAAVAQAMAAGTGVHGVMAALQDVVPADDAGTGFLGRDQWLGELWEARRTDRPLIDSLGEGTLTSTKAKGWRWVTRPAVEDYAGNKTPVPSNKVSTEPAEALAKRMAGGWDVDRIYVDLGDPAMIQALFQAAVEDYAVKTEAKAGALVAADATVLPGDTTVPAALGRIGSAASVVGARVSFLFMAPDLWAGFTNLNRDQVPWWMGSADNVNLTEATANVNGLRLGMNAGLAAGTYVGGDRRAVTWYEPGRGRQGGGGHPIRVQAENIANGGVDLGVFAYYAHITHDAGAIFTGTVAPAVETPPAG